ncbi:hypothetical protein Tco_0948759 [Tanacetum coccineum]
MFLTTRSIRSAIPRASTTAATPMPPLHHLPTGATTAAPPPPFGCYPATATPPSSSSCHHHLRPPSSSPPSSQPPHHKGAAGLCLNSQKGASGLSPPIRVRTSERSGFYRFDFDTGLKRALTWVKKRDFGPWLLVWARLRIMPPRMRTRSVGRPAAESLGEGTGERVGRGGRVRIHREGNDERVDDLNGQGNDQGMGANGGVEGVNGNVEEANGGALDFSTIIA